MAPGAEAVSQTPSKLKPIMAPGAEAVSQTPLKPKPIVAPRGKIIIKNYKSNYVAKTRNNYSANR